MEDFEAKRVQLLADYPEGAEDEDEYRADNVFRVPPPARWSRLQADARRLGIGKVVDDAMLEVGKVNPDLKGVLPKKHARTGVNAVMLGELLSGIGFKDSADTSRDVLRRFDVVQAMFHGFDCTPGRSRPSRPTTKPKGLPRRRSPFTTRWRTMGAPSTSWAMTVRR